MPSIQLGPGATLRFFMLQTHYRRPIDITASGLAAAEKSLHRLVRAAEPTTEGGMPVEALEYLCDDLNTAGLMALLHKYRKDGRGKELFQCLRFLGFFDCGGQCPDEWKTLPEDQTPRESLKAKS